MRLNPPTVFVFFISLVLAVTAIISKLGYISIPGFIPHQSFWLAIGAYIFLMIGNLVRGL